MDGGAWVDASGYLFVEDPFMTAEFVGGDSDVEALVARSRAKKRPPKEGSEE